MSRSFGRTMKSAVMVAFASAISFQAAVADDTESVVVEAPGEVQMVSTPVAQDDELVIGEEESSEPVADESEVVDSVPSEPVVMDATSDQVIMGDSGTVVDSCGCGGAVAPAPVVMDSGCGCGAVAAPAVMDSGCGCGCGAPMSDYTPSAPVYNDPYVPSIPTPVQPMPSVPVEPMPIAPMPVQPMPVSPGIVFSGDEGARPVMAPAPAAMSAPAMVFVGDEGARPVTTSAYSIQSAPAMSAPRKQGCFQRLRQRLQSRGSRGCNSCR